MAKKVIFYRGIKANHNIVTHADGIYFATDTLEILMNGACYGGSGLEQEKTVKNIEQGASADKLKVIYTDDSTVDITVGKSTYTSLIEDADLQMPSAVGGLAKGTKVSDLSGKSYDSMFDDLLFPTVNPTFTVPSASISIAAPAVREFGSVAPVISNLTTSFNPGAITLNGVKQANRAGVINAVNSYVFVNGQKTEAGKVLPTTVALGGTTYTYHAEYEVGAQPKDNKGNNYSLPLVAGGVDSSAATINGTYPWFATTVDNTTETKQALIAWNASTGTMVTPKFTLKPSGGGNQIIKLPRKITSLQMENTISGNMEVIGLGEWNETQETISIGGTDVTYFKYTYTGAARDSVNLIAKF